MSAADERPRQRVPVEELVDLEALGSGGKPPSRRALRAALPRGWVLEEDGRTARRDLRLFFREGWILLTGLVLFGLLGGLFLWEALPAGWWGVVRLALLLGALLLVGGLVAPRMTLALQRRRERGDA